MDVNVNGVLFTAQAAGQQMVRFGNGGSIVLVASMSGSITNKVNMLFFPKTAEVLIVAMSQDHAWVSYNTSKSAVLQMARSMACELGPKQIRVNTLSPGYIYTKCVCDFDDRAGALELIVTPGHGRLTAAYLDTQPHLLGKWENLNPMGRIGRPDELRGVVTWLTSDASTFCTGSEYVRASLA